MEIKELIQKKRRDFDIAISLIGVIPFLILTYLMSAKVSSINVFVGETGYIMFCAIVFFMIGVFVTRNMLWSLILELIEKNKLVAITETALALGHEINNPLLAINGNLELLENDLTGIPVPDKAKSRLDLIKLNCERIRQVTEKLSSLSKPVSEIICGDSSMIDLSKSK